MKDLRFYDVTHQGKHYSLPSVTSIIGATMAKPELVSWTYRTTIENVALALQAIEESSAIEALDMLETLADPEELDRWLRDSAMRPDDLTEEASLRGKAAHDLLNRLASMSMVDRQRATAHAKFHAEREYPPGQAWNRGVAEWWLATQPKVLLTEAKVYKIDDETGRSYAGTLDLAYDIDCETRVMDLKTRREVLPEYRIRKDEWIKDEPPVWDSDQVQARAYAEALRWMHGRDAWGYYHSSVLSVEGGGSYIEKVTTVSPRVFENLLANYYELGGHGGEVKKVVEETEGMEK